MKNINENHGFRLKPQHALFIFDTSCLSRISNRELFGKKQATHGEQRQIKYKSENITAYKPSKEYKHCIKQRIYLQQYSTSK